MKTINIIIVIMLLISISLIYIGLSKDTTIQNNIIPIKNDFSIPVESFNVNTSKINNHSEKLEYEIINGEIKYE